MAKPIVLPEWDETEVNSVEPDATHKSEGWLAPAGVPEKPPYQSFNFWQNNVWKWLQELNIKGILGYDNLTDYVADLSYVIGSDGFLYKCVINNGPSSSIVDPVGDITGTWLVHIFNNDNILINQDFSIWQKAISFTNPVTATHTADGYNVGKADGDGTAPSINVKENTAVHETEFEQTMELEITNVGVQGTTVRWYTSQKVEDYKKYRGKTVTAAIRIKASTTINLSDGDLFLYDGIDFISIPITSVTATWITYSGTLTIDSAASELNVRFQLIPTGSGTISTTGSIYIQWMKLELSSGFAGPPIPRSEGEELALCQRRRQKSYATGIYPGATTEIGAKSTQITGLTNLVYSFLNSVKLLSMAGTPTITIYDKVGNVGRVTMYGVDNIVGTVGNIGNTGFTVIGTDTAKTGRQLTFHYIAEYDL